MQRESAETVGVQALGVAGRERRAFAGFPLAPRGLRSTTFGPGQGSGVPGSVLDFVMMDDAWVVAFCDAVGIAYTTPMQARAALPGGAVTHWT